MGYLTAHYNIPLVALSILIATVACFAIIDFAARVYQVEQERRTRWMFLGATATGFGIWSMHFIGLLAVSLPTISIAYRLNWVILSIFPAFLTAFMALYIATRPVETKQQLVLGSILMGLALGCMHYIGMEAAVMNADLQYSTFRVVLSGIIAIVTSYLILKLSIIFRNCTKWNGRKIAVSFVLGISLHVMHFSGMVSAMFVSTHMTEDEPARFIMNTSLLAVFVGVGVLVLFATMFLAAYFDQKLHETKSLYELISENALDVITVSTTNTPDRVLEYVSPAVKQVLGYDCEELIGKTARDLYHPDDLQKFTNRYFAEENIFTARVRRKDGSYVWMETKFKILRKRGEEKALGIGRDITSRKLAEQEVKQREESLAQAQRIAHLGSWDWNLITDDIFLSEETYNIAGLHPNNFMPSFKEFLNLVHPDDQHLLQRIVQRSFGGDKFDVEYRIVRPDGSERVVWSQGDVIFQDLKPVRIIGTLLDISERKKAENDRQEAERLLAEREKEYRLISENSLDMISKHTPDKQAVFTYVSPACRTLLGYEPEELIGHSTYEFYHTDDVAAVTEDINQLLNYKDVKVIYRLRRKDGNFVWVESTGRTVLDEQRNPVEILVFTRDISDRKQHLEEFDQLSYQNSLILDSVAEGIYGLDLNKKIMFCNRAAEKMLGYQHDDLLGKSPSDTFRHHVPIEPKLYYHNLQEKGIHVVDDEEFYRKDGSSFPVEFMTTPMIDNGSIVGAVITFTDITKRKEEERHEQERKQMDLELSLAASVQDSLLPGVETLNVPVNCEVGVISTPARTLNGDFYNFSTDDQTFLFGVADISGKGIPAAILMSMMKFAMDEAVKQGHSPSRLLDVLNRYALKYTDSTMFVTMFVGSYDKDKHRFEYSSAGHEPAILYRSATDEFEELATEGIVLGLSDDFRFPARSVSLQPGDMILVYTDGVIERRDDPDADNSEVLKSLLRRVDQSLPAQSIAEGLHQQMRDLNCGNVVDDETLLLFRRIK